MAVVHHYEKIDLNRIEAKFSNDENDEKKHRLSLLLPFKDRMEGSTVCVIGQNPSYANAETCDKTLHYMEHLIYDKCPEVGRIVVLNLFSRVDTKKTENYELLSLQAARECRKWIKKCSDFLIVYGKISNKGAYKFKKRAQQIRSLLVEKQVRKLDISTRYPPHPGNSAIYYGNYNVGLAKYNFEDME